MGERLTDEQVANLAVWIADSGITKAEGEALAREVRDWRRFAPTLGELCGRHGITIEGIMALVDEVFDDDAWQRLRSTRDDLRRLARTEADRG